MNTRDGGEHGAEAKDKRNDDEQMEAGRPAAAGEEPQDAFAGRQEEPESDGAARLSWFARLSQIRQRSSHGNQRTEIKREQLKANRTKSFLALGALTVLGALVFVALFSSPPAARRPARPNQPNLGGGPGGGTSEQEGSVTPLLNANQQHSDEGPDKISADDVRRTAKERPPARVGEPQPRAEDNDYALNKIELPEPPPPRPTPAPDPVPAPKPESLNKPSIVFVSNSAAGTGPRVTVAAGRSSGELAVVSQMPELELPAGTRLVARLETPVSTAVKTPVVAAIEYNYERDGQIVIPAGSKAFGDLAQANERGYVGIRFHTIQLPEEARSIEGYAVGLQFEPLRGAVTGRNTGKRFLARSLTGIGSVLAATLGTQAGTGVNDTLSNNVLLREQLLTNIGQAGDQEINQLGNRQNIVVTVPGNTRFYIVLARRGAGRRAESPHRVAPMGNTAAGQQLDAAAIPTVQELRELMDLKQELTRLYQQQKPPVEQSAAEEQQ